MVLHGLWTVEPVWAAVAASGLVLSVLYMLSFYRRLFYGAVGSMVGGLAPLDMRERVLLVLFAVFVLLLGIYPNLYLDTLDGSLVGMDGLLRDLRTRVGLLSGGG